MRNIVIYNLSDLLDTGLERETLDIVVQMCEIGVNPDALASAIHEIERSKSV